MKSKFYIILFLFSFFFLFVDCDSLGLLVYDTSIQQYGNGFSYYTENFKLKNITQKSLKKGAIMKGIGSTIINNKEYVIMNGIFSFYQNQKIDNDLLFFSKNSSKFVLNSIFSTDVQTMILMNDNQVFLVGNIESVGNVPAENCLICDLIQEDCKVLNDGTQIGLPDYLSTISHSYNQIDQIIYIIYMRYIPHDGRYGSSLISWDQNKSKKK